MRIDHAQLRALAAVVREGSFERAAQSLNVTSSAVSQRIKALEDRVGRLLVKRSSPAVATPEGQVLVQLAEQTALLEHDALHRMGLADEDLPQASIPVAVNHDSLETWFPEAARSFASQTGTTLDLRLEDQDHTVALLRQGAVLGAVTTLDEPVQGCQIHALGSIRYAATCTPAFHEKHFSKGVNAQSLAQAPVLVFNRKDDLQARFARRLAGEDLPLTAPTWWIPSTRAFVQANLGGLGWTMNPLPLVKRHLEAGRLVYMKQRAWEDVPLYWQHWKGDVQTMALLTRAVLAASAALVRKKR
ncbi:MAG: LysR family transcriptional regulator ArgP [Stenotrophomonas rhizophila]|jgi:LysR family transcriptional regulator (chromosome initiation inhibitor)|uniref:LysR family transcriptional regulator ArgP n=1 Tax=Stenotrophomonas rhizophila TaxID=216778 RepID=UPI0010BFF71B|nr:LysR family transcriptional regulator ArgP [Stenotrophomonas rhizophila]MDY0955281.1 LysR family transcriptional regulator ArgP [Stenotrophomonas rhizophila]TKK08821.1 LysR family transcriptional regulator ArgP [Stenotrophomonas rhizophila]